MKIACTTSPGRGEIDLLLFRLSDRLIRRGVRLCGAVQDNSDPDSGGACDMDLKVLPHGPVIRISQSLGRASESCRLDPHALETAAELTDVQLAAGADLLLINKFGKLESEGRGFRATMADALLSDVPVLVGLNRLNEAAFLEFTGGCATNLPPDLAALESWACRLLQV